ncbi:MAG: hypothetical protein AAGB24_06370 [Bacteroidota bacterium]
MALMAAINTNAQLVIDDFSTGDMNQARSSIGEKEYHQSGSKILKKKRSLTIKIKENPQKQLFQAKIRKGKLVSSIGYEITGVLELRYGGNRGDATDLDLTQYKNIHIAYKGKSNFGGEQAGLPKCFREVFHQVAATGHLYLKYH